MQVKVYVITEVGRGRERVIAVRLTHEAARAIAKQGGGRRVEAWTATKNKELHVSEKRRDDCN